MMSQNYASITVRDQEHWTIIPMVAPGCQKGQGGGDTR
jgi:hypothetical protein